MAHSGKDDGDSDNWGSVGAVSGDRCLGSSTTTINDAQLAKLQLNPTQGMP